MKKSSVCTAFVFVAFLSSSVLADHHKTTTREDFKQWCDAWKGRWIGEVTWVADWPGLGKKGDKVTAYLEATTIEDGNGMVAKFFGGNGSGTVVFAYDAVAKQIKSMTIVSGGFTGTAILYKKDGKWVQESRGSLPDGKTTKGTSLHTYSDGGNTLTITGSGTVDGKPNDEQRDVWRRVSK